MPDREQVQYQEKITGIYSLNERFLSVRHYSRYDIGEKEQDIIALVGVGKSNREIADELFLSEGTVRNYISSILDKLSLRDRTQLAVFYLTKVCN